MNKIFTKIAAATVGLTLAIVGCSNVASANRLKPLKAAGQETVYKEAKFGSSYNSNGVSDYTSTWSSTNDGFTVSLTNFNNYNNGWNYVKCGRKNTASVGTISTSSAIDVAITKVEVTIDVVTASKVNSMKLYSSSNGSSWSEEGSYTVGTGAKSVSPASPAANRYYKVEFDCASGSSNGLVTVSGLKYYYLEPASEDEYTVTFDKGDGSSPTYQSVLKSGTCLVEEPADPTRAGFVFTGWYEQEAAESFDFDNPIDGDLTLYAHWEKVAVTTNYSPSGTLIDGQGYRISGEVVLVSGGPAFFIQDGGKTMQIYDSNYSSTVAVGNVVDVFGIYDATYKELKTLAYCDKTSSDTTNSQTALDDLDDVTDENLFKYIELSQLQLSSGFSGNSYKQASLNGSDVILYLTNESAVDWGSYSMNQYASGDYVSIKGVVFKHNSTFELYISYINKLAQYTITFNLNGGDGENFTQSVLQGNKVVEPANEPERASTEEYDYDFDCWCTDQAGQHPYDFNLDVESNFPLYARWIRTDRDPAEVVEALKTKTYLSYNYTKTGDSATDTLNNEFSGVEGTSYTSWGNNGTSGVSYSGQSAGGTTNSGATIQLRTTNSNSGIVTTASPNTKDYHAARITVTWNSETDPARLIDIYGKDTAYTAPSDLYGDNKGTSLGSINYGSTELVISGSYKYIGIRSHSGALYIDEINIEWEEPAVYTYSSVALRFGGLISQSLWNRLTDVQEFGVLFARADYLANQVDHDLSHYFNNPDQNNVYKLSSDAEHPAEADDDQKGNLDGDYYVWTICKSVPSTRLTRGYVAIAYIETSTDVIFMQKAEDSAQSAALSLLNSGAYANNAFQGSLYNLAHLS